MQEGASMLEKIAGFLLLRKSISAGTSLIESLLVGMALVFMLGLLASMLLTSLIAGGIYVAYHVMIAHGVVPLTADYILGCVIFLMFMIIVLAAMLFAYRISYIPKQLVSADSAIGRHVNEAIDAFADGFATASAKK